jgi:Na+/H+ antiporter NhaD/arsenite permease-like protein
MMVIVAVTRKCGVFQFVAIWSAKKVQARPWGTLVMVVAGFAERAGTPIRFVPYLKTAFPLMLLSIAISHVYVYFRYF